MNSKFTSQQNYISPSNRFFILQQNTSSQQFTPFLLIQFAKLYATPFIVFKFSTICPSAKIPFASIRFYFYAKIVVRFFYNHAGVYRDSSSSLPFRRIAQIIACCHIAMYWTQHIVSLFWRRNRLLFAPKMCCFFAHHLHPTYIHSLIVC